MESAFYGIQSSIQNRGSALPHYIDRSWTAVDSVVHGAVKAHQKLTDAKDLPLPTDYIVAATGNRILGSLHGALEVRGITLPPADIAAEVVGIDEMRGPHVRSRT